MMSGAKTAKTGDAIATTTPAPQKCGCADRNVTIDVSVKWGTGADLPKGNTPNGPATKTPYVIWWQPAGDCYEKPRLVDSGKTSDPDGKVSKTLRLPDVPGYVVVAAARVVSFQGYEGSYGRQIGTGNQTVSGTITMKKTTAARALAIQLGQTMP